MNKREKILAIATMVLVGGGLTFILLRGLLLSPSAAMGSRISWLQAEIARHNAEIARKGDYEARWDKLGGQTLKVASGQTEQALYGPINRLLYELQLRGGFRSGAITPITRPGPAGSSKITVDINADGTLPRVVDLLYLLSRQPYVSRIDEFTLSPQQQSARDGSAVRISVQMKFSTLIIPGQQGKVDPSDIAVKVDELLASDERKSFDQIVVKNVFQAYQARPPVVVQTAPRGGARNVGNAGPSYTPQPASPASLYKLLGGLTSDANEFGVMDLQQAPAKITYYRPGDKLPDGSVVAAVDAMPRENPNQPGKFSNWRVIVRFGGKYYAVEENEYLYQRHSVKPEDMPRSLQTTTAPSKADGQGSASGDNTGKTG